MYWPLNCVGRGKAVRVGIGTRQGWFEEVSQAMGAEEIEIGRQVEQGGQKHEEIQSTETGWVTRAGG